MAARTIGPNDRALHAAVLAAGVEDTVDVTGWNYGDPTVIVHPGATAPVYVSTDATPATVGGAATRVVFAGNALRLLNVPDLTSIRLISAAAATYSVEGS